MHLHRLTVPIVILLCVYLCTAQPVIDHGNYIRTKSNHLSAQHRNNGIETNPSKVYGKGSDDVKRPRRWKREYELNIEAEHEDNTGTDLMATLQYNLYSTEHTRVDVSARYSQHIGDDGAYGNARYGGKLSIIHT